MLRPSQLFLWMLLCGAVACFTPEAQAQTKGKVPGHILVAKVKGDVFASTTDETDNTKKKTRQLRDNERISQDYTVTTGTGASVILIFSNGATLNLGAESELSIEEFMQDPFSDAIKVADMKEEPTTSRTTLKLARGELVGDVKHLHREQGSDFKINTPVGAAGIRGTTFRIVFKPDASGKVFFTLTTDTGEVLFTAPAAPDVSVPADQEVVVAIDATVDTTTGTITVNTPPTITGTTDITADNKAAIQVAVAAIVEQTSKSIIDSTQQAADKAAAEKEAADKAAAEKAAAEKEAAEKAAAEKASEEAKQKAAEEAKQKEAEEAAQKAAEEAAQKAAEEAKQKEADRLAAERLKLEKENPPANTEEQQTTRGDGT